jgi:hypothetical protein
MAPSDQHRTRCPILGEVAMMDGRQARLYFQVYQALVGAAYVQTSGGERSHALLRAWTYYARPLIDVLWYEDSDPVSVETAHQLIGWLLWLRGQQDPETFFHRAPISWTTRRG